MKKKLGQGVFTNIVLGGAPEPIRKDGRVFLPGPDGIYEVDPDAVELLLESMSGEVEVTEPEMFSPGTGANFPTKPLPSAADGRGDFMNAVPKPYDVDRPSTTMARLPGGTFIASNVDPGIAKPASFEVPEPGPLLLTKRESDRPIDTRRDAWLNADIKKLHRSLFRDIVQPGSEPVEQIFGDDEQ